MEEVFPEYLSCIGLEGKGSLATSAPWVSMMKKRYYGVFPTAAMVQIRL